MRETFRFNSGVVMCDIRMLPGCCGIVLISELTFGPSKRSHQVLYRDFHKELMKDYSRETWRDDGQVNNNLSRGKLLITDAVNGEYRTGPCPARFCRSMKWDEIGTHCYNPNSNRHITMFEFNRYPRKYNCMSSVLF